MELEGLVKSQTLTSLSFKLLCREFAPFMKPSHGFKVTALLTRFRIIVTISPFLSIYKIRDAPHPFLQSRLAAVKKIRRKLVAQLGEKKKHFIAFFSSFCRDSSFSPSAH